MVSVDSVMCKWVKLSGRWMEFGIRCGGIIFSVGKMWMYVVDSGRCQWVELSGRWIKLVIKSG